MSVLGATMLSRAKGMGAGAALCRCPLGAGAALCRCPLVCGASDAEASSWFCTDLSRRGGVAVPEG